MLENIDAFLKDDHFVYSSGKHGDVYINKNDLFAYTRTMCSAGILLAEKYLDSAIDTVVGPAMCGVIPAHCVAYQLSQHQKKEIFGIFAERNSQNDFEFKRGYEKFVAGKNVLIVDDITNSGTTIKKLIKAVQSIGGNIIAVEVMVNRNPKEVNRETLAVPFTALSAIEIPAYEEKQCPLCEKKMPINTMVGHGKEYMQKKKN